MQKIELTVVLLLLCVTVGYMGYQALLMPKNFIKYLYLAVSGISLWIFGKELLKLLIT